MRAGGPKRRVGKAQPAHHSIPRCSINGGHGASAPLPTLRILPVAPRAAQRRQADAGGIKTAVDGEDLPGDVACTIAAQEEDRLRQFLLEAVTIERNGVVIV